MTPEVALGLAQIIPVFFLGYLIEDGRFTRRLKSRKRRQSESRATYVISLGTVGLVVDMLVIANAGGIQGPLAIPLWIVVIAMMLFLAFLAAVATLRRDK